MPAVKRQGRQSRPDTGFTLTELAVVLVIVSLLLGGLLLPMSSQIDSRNLNDTRKSLAEIREALLGFAAVNGRLPCPAPAATASGVAGAGLEAALVGGVCPNDSGVLPWATLGVAESDAWGRRYTYRVTPVFARSVPPPPTVWPLPCTTNPQNAAFVLCSTGDLDVCSANACPVGSKIASAVPAVVISHGRNGNGAFTPAGVQLPVGAEADEQDNQLTGGGVTMADRFFVSKTQTPTFDDELVWISPGLLFNRMISAGKLP